MDYADDSRAQGSTPDDQAAEDRGNGFGGPDPSPAKDFDADDDDAGSVRANGFCRHDRDPHRRGENVRVHARTDRANTVLRADVGTSTCADGDRRTSRVAASAIGNASAPDSNLFSDLFRGRNRLTLPLFNPLTKSRSLPDYFNTGNPRIPRALVSTCTSIVPPLSSLVSANRRQVTGTGFCPVETCA